jgi:hypothetical protein
LLLVHGFKAWGYRAFIAFEDDHLTASNWQPLAATLVPVCDYFMSDEHWQMTVVTEGYKEACLSKTVFGVMKLAYRRHLIDYGLLVAVKT